jgi:hypothetical protein
MPLIELTDEELVLLLEALEEAAFFRDARSNIVRAAVRRRDRRLGSPETRTGEVGDEHQRKAQAYQALASRLRQGPN